jgi:hypothetical protein
VRIFIALPLLALGACNVENDAANDQVRVEYNQQKIESAAEEAARTTRDVASSVGNVAETTGRAIKNEVGDIDVDVDVRRDKAEPANSQ